MLDEVWESKLVQFLVAKDELNLIPWKEIIAERVATPPEAFQDMDHRVSLKDFTSLGVYGLPNLDRTPFNLFSWRKFLPHMIPARKSVPLQWLPSLHFFLSRSTYI